MKRILLTLALMPIFVTPALSLEAKVRLACTGDYFRYCSHTWPGSAASKQCFRDTGKSLSRKCRSAIRVSVEFRSEYLARVIRGSH